MTRLAIVGIGGYGWHLVETIRAVSEQADCRLVAAADARFAAFPERTAQLRSWGVDLFDDAHEMLAALRGKCEAVYVATGIASHAPLAIAAAEAGFHVHVEKPPCGTVQELDRMQAALDAAGRIGMVGFQALHARDIGLIKERIVAGRLGRIQSLVCRAGWPRRKSYYNRNEWAGRLRVGPAWVLDGPAMNALAHQVANMLFLASPEPCRLAAPAAVRAELYAAGPVPSHDTAAIEIRTAQGATAWFVASHCSRETFGPTIDIIADGGSASWTMRQGGTIRYADGTEETVGGHDGSKAMVADFVHAIQTGDASGLTGRLADTRPFLLALDGAHESSRCIHRIGPPHTQRVDGPDDPRTVVDGLDDLIARAALGKCLFSDLPDAPPWAVATDPFDLAGYRTFPQTFAPD